MTLTSNPKPTDGEGVSRDACYTHLREEFPRQMGRVRRLMDHSADFREACDDYEECARIIARLRRDPGSSTAVIDVYRNLGRELEAEIRRWIRGAGSGTKDGSEPQNADAS